MTTCNLCGVEVRWAYSRETNTAGLRRNVRLDNVPSIKGPHRFREVSYDPLIVEAVDERFEGTAYAIHECGRT